MEDLFSQLAKSKAPLADRMRPRTLDEFIGQKHVVGPGRPAAPRHRGGQPDLNIFFGPPGCGKTTLASIIAEATRSKFVKINAVSTGVKEMRQILEQAKQT
ncbi:MAG: AAA family ATPase [Christensenellales bacterium]